MNIVDRLARKRALSLASALENLPVDGDYKIVALSVYSYAQTPAGRAVAPRAAFWLRWGQPLTLWVAFVLGSVGSAIFSGRGLGVTAVTLIVSLGVVLSVGPLLMAAVDTQLQKNIIRLAQTDEMNDLDQQIAAAAHKPATRS